MELPLRNDAELPFSLACSTALQPLGRRTKSCGRLKSALKSSTLMATLLCLPLTALNLWAQNGSDEYVYRPVTILAGGYVPGLIAHPTESGLIYARTDIGSVYRWEPSADLTLIGSITHGFPDEGPTGPQFVFVDRVDDFYYLGIASSNWGWGQLLRAACGALFPTCKKGEMDLSAFKPVSSNSILPASAESRFPFQVVGSPCQVKLIKDSTGQWHLLAFRSDPPDSETGTDYVDAYAIQFSPFAIFGLVFSTHIVFPSGDTSFASTGTHYVEDTGRLLVSSSYRWSEDEGPGNSGYVSRVDECPSS